MIEDIETFDGTFPFKPHFSVSPGFRMHYVDEGQGPAILCLHGEPTSAYLYREVIPILAKDHRVIVPDFMGFGKSETPNVEYTAKRHTDNLEILVKELNLHDITLVVHDWGGQIGGALALRQPQLIRRMVVMNTMLSMGESQEVECWEKNAPESAWFRWADRAMADGTFEATLRNAGVSIVGLMKMLQGFERRETSEAFFRAYSLPFATPEECHGVIAFPKSIVTGSFKQEKGTAETIAALKVIPAMMIYGMKDKVLLAKYFIPVFKAAFPNAPVHQLENASHFLLEDAPEEVGELILSFVKST
ncbi:putative Alpha/beta hydrolase [Trichoderma austrokoningii]